MRTTWRAAFAAMALVAASACSHVPNLGEMMEPGAPGPVLSERDRVRAAIELLSAGEERRAQQELRAVLRDHPGNNAARRLMDQIERDPRELLRGEPRPYTVRRGETMALLAERYFGDPLLFYALARYNDVAAANDLSEGQVLIIPRRPGERVTTTAANVPPANAPAAQSAVVATPPRTAESARANQLRLQALQDLNAGRVDTAVSLLRQARALDDANPAIQRDLDRALRLQQSLSRG